MSRADGTPPLAEHLVKADGTPNTVSISYRFEVYNDDGRLYNATTETAHLEIDPSGLVVFTTRVPRASDKFEIHVSVIGFFPLVQCHLM